MKKLFLLLVVAVLMPLGVKGETFYAGEQVKEVPIYLDKITKQSYRYFKTAYRTSDNVLVYCVEPDKLLNLKQDYTYVTDKQWEELNISQEKWRRIELLGYFGYGYKNHTDKKWAAITQYLLWQTVLPEGWFLTFTDGYEGEFKNIHEKETKEIESLLKNFETLPSFENENFKITKNNKLILKDTNGVLSNYKLVSQTALNVKINNNELVVEGVENGEYTLEFVRGQYKPTKLYLSSEDQAVISADGEPEKRFKITVVVESGNLTLKRKLDNYLENDSTAENATYEIIDSESNKHILTTNKNGEIELFDLPLGDVKIKELTPSTGYEVDNEIYNIEIKNNENVVLEVNPKLIMKKVNIIKKYLVPEENLLPSEVNSVFSVVKNSEYKLTSVTDNNGLVSFLIPYGKYTITQNSTILDYELMPDYEIFVETNEEETLTFINYKKPVTEEIPEEAPNIPNDSEEPKEDTPPETENKESSEDKEEVKEDNEILDDENIEEDLIKDETNIPKEEILDNKENDSLTNNEDNTLENSNNKPIETIPNENLNNVNDKEPSKEQPVIENPKTEDNFPRYFSLLLLSSFILGKIIRKMQ